MSNTIKSNSAVLLESPKGYGLIRNNTKGQNITFENAITIYGKKHLLNAITAKITAGGVTNKIPKLSGLAVLFRRCGTPADPPTKDGHKLTKGFFEHIYCVTSTNTANVARSVDSGSTKFLASITDATCNFQLNEVTAKTDNSGSWGASSTSGTQCVDPDANYVWNTGANTQAPKGQGADQCLKEESNNTGFGYAKIAGIAVLTTEIGGYSGGTQTPSVHHNSGGAIGNTVKVWRDPTFMELIHQQESLRKPGTGVYEMPEDDSHYVQSMGHYFPNLEHFAVVNTNVVATGDGGESIFQLGDDHLIGGCSLEPGNNHDQASCEAITPSPGVWSPSHNIWEWKHTAIDTFAFSGFVTHWYGANEGSAGLNVGEPFKSLDMTNRASGNLYNGVGWVSDVATAMATGPFYKPIARQAGNFSAGASGYDFPTIAYWAWGDHDHAMTRTDVLGGTSVLKGDGLLPDTITGYEIDYDKGGSQGASEQENFIDVNDTLSTKYTINFGQSSSYATALDGTDIDTQQNNNLGALMSTTIEDALGKHWALDFGQAHANQNINGWQGSTRSAIHSIRLFDKAGRTMACHTAGGGQQQIGNDLTMANNFDYDDDSEGGGANPTGTESFKTHALDKSGEELATQSVYVKNTLSITNDHINDRNTTYILDASAKRPRMLIQNINLVFNQLHVGAETTNPDDRPHKLELYGNGTASNDPIADDLLFTFILGSSDFADNITGDLASPFFNADDASSGEILSSGVAWTNGNHLDVTLKLVMV